MNASISISMPQEPLMLAVNFETDYIIITHHTQNTLPHRTSSFFSDWDLVSNY